MLITWLMDTSVNCSVKSSHGILIQYDSYVIEAGCVCVSAWQLIIFMTWLIYLRLNTSAQGTVVNNQGPDRFIMSKSSRFQSLQTTNPLIARPLSESPNCAMHGNELRLFGAKAFLLLILIMSRIWLSSSRHNF